jgi:hypothetical protein
VFGGFCLLLFFLAILVGDSPSSCVGVVVCFFGQFCFWFLLGQIFSDLNSVLPVVGVGGFCLESLILAQDERWRRA